jgi:hypothetical protein
MAVGECPHAWRQEDVPKPIGSLRLTVPVIGCPFAAHGRLRENVGALDRFGPSKKLFARVGQSVAAVALVKETAAQLVFSA